MPKNVEDKIAKIVKGECQYTSKNLGFNLLISRLQLQYNLDKSPNNLNKCMTEVKDFMAKYEKAMSAEFDSIIRA